MPQVRANFAQLMSPGMKKIYNDTTDYELTQLQFPSVFNEKTSVDEYEQSLEMAALPPLQEKPENTSTVYGGLIQGGSKRVIHLTYSLGIESSKELMDDDKYGIIKTGPAALARSTQFTREAIAWNILNQGFSNNVTTFDGQPLFSNTHYLLGGPAATNIAPGVSNIISAPGTYPNAPSVGMDLSVSALQYAINTANRMIDNQGFPINLKFKYLCIPSELIFIAREILGSSGKPYTSDNEINSLLAEDLKVIVPKYLTSSSTWFLLTDKSQHSLTVYNREKPATSFDDNFDTDSIKQKTRMRMSAVAWRWQGVWGTQGP
jgi:hypothetical protein